VNGVGSAPGMSRAAISPNGRVLRHPGDLEWLERRRVQAADLPAQGRTKAEVAGELGVSAQTASRWYARWRGGGAAGMRTARHGKPARLGPAELAKLRRVLDRGAVAAGFDNDLWTLARIAQVIEQITRVAHHPGHVWRLLKAMRWRLQRPARKAVERDEAEMWTLTLFPGAALRLFPRVWPSDEFYRVTSLPVTSGWPGRLLGR
jgi:transposase